MRYVVVAGLWPRGRMDNAGGVQIRERVVRLASVHEVVLIVPDRVDATAEEQGIPSEITVLKCPHAADPTSLATRALEFAERTLSGELTPGRRWRAGWVSPDVADTLALADVVEVHWAAYLPLIEDIRQCAPHAKTAIVEHDIQTQGLRRRAESESRAPRRWAARVAAQVSRFREPRFCNRYDEVKVYSEKDRDLLQALGVRTPIDVMAFSIPLSAVPAKLDSQTVLFTGALYRPENDHAATWLIDKVWPEVRRQVPDARLQIVGSGPSSRLQQLGVADVSVTGFVEDFHSIYAAARVMAVPLHMGAGKKVKVQEAAAAGVPVVATSVGAEGYPPEILTIADDPASFASELVQLLRDDDRATRLAARGRAWAKAATESL